MTDGVLLLAMVYAAVGLGLSVVVHLLSFAGVEIGGTTLFWVMHAGIFPLWAPVALAGGKMSRRAPDQDHWEATMSGCPAWMRYMAQGFFFYGVFIFVSVALLHGDPSARRAERDSAGTVRIFGRVDDFLFGRSRDRDVRLSARSLPLALRAGRRRGR